VVLFTVVIGYLMLNMLLAIIMDTYMQVKGRVGHCETLWSQASEIFRRYRQLKRGERVSLIHIVKHLRPVVRHLRPSLGGAHSPLPGETSTNAVITKETFMAAVPNLQERQAERLLRNSYMENKSSEEAHISLVETFQTVRKIASEQENMKQHINFIDKVVSFIANCVRPRDRTTVNGATSKVGAGNSRLDEDIPPWAKRLETKQDEIIAMQKQMSQYMGTQFKNMASKHDSLSNELQALRLQTKALIIQTETNTS
jgi:hypothetical protein